jgi:hypothetical protein
MFEMLYFAVSIRKDCILSKICWKMQPLQWNSENVQNPYVILACSRLIEVEMCTVSVI